MTSALDQRRLRRGALGDGGVDAGRRHHAVGDEALEEAPERRERREERLERVAVDGEEGFDSLDSTTRREIKA